MDRAKKDPFVTYMLSVQDDYLYSGTGIDPAKKKPIAENYFKGNLAEASSHITTEMIDSFTLVGTREEVSSRVLEYLRAGIESPYPAADFHEARGRSRSPGRGEQSY